MAKNLLDGLLKNVNNVSRMVDTVNRTKNNIKRTVGVSGAKSGSGLFNRKQKNQAEDATSWKCACGASNTTAFCGGCGKPAPAELECPNCKWTRPAENSNLKFCGNCGTQLEE